MRELECIEVPGANTLSIYLVRRHPECRSLQYTLDFHNPAPVYCGIAFKSKFFQSSRGEAREGIAHGHNASTDLSLQRKFMSNKFIALNIMNCIRQGLL